MLSRQRQIAQVWINHTFRATGITAYLENGGTIEHAQQIANHESPKTTKLYDRTSDQIDLDEIEKIQI
jgi:integrase/recombinase XerD